MSFATTFPDDERVYLHDDMYDLLEKYVYVEVADAREGQIAAQAIYEYYKEEAIKQKNEKLQNIFASLAQEDSEQSTAPSKEYVEEIQKIESSRQRLKTEFIHYRLRSQVAKDGKRKASEDDPILGG